MKKGQAAIEFLLTYGWAIIVVGAAIFALFYFGIFDQIHAKYPGPDINKASTFCEVQNMTFYTPDWKYDMFFCTNSNKEKIAYNLKDLERITVAGPK